MRTLIVLVLYYFIFLGCQSKADRNNWENNIPKLIPTPCLEGGESNLFVSNSGQVYLSWVEYINDTTDALLFSTLEGERWTTPKTIASGIDWFVNWADFPSLVLFDDDENYMAAHWLQKSAQGTYDYDVRIALSNDGGKSWNSSFIPHRDSISAEHGFVSLFPLNGDKVFATWLDGRNTKNTGHDHAATGHQGAMTLRSAVFDHTGMLSEESELDERVCDCCQTSAAMTDKGMIVAYRNRSDDEVRDISVVRQVDGKWLVPSVVFADNWMIAGCPVNGPSIRADAKHVAIAWFTMPEGKPQVKVAFSSNSGETFSSPIQIDDGNPLGRVDLVFLENGHAVVSWMEQLEEHAEIRIAQVGKKGVLSGSKLIAKTKASRESGFPIMKKSGNQLIFAWTQVDSLTHVTTGILDLGS